MFKRAAFVLVLFSAIVHAQHFNFEGSVRDAETKKGIPFATVLFQNIKKGTSADKKGVFKLAVDENLKKELVSISCVGYESKFIRFDELKDAIVFLNPKIDELAAVKLYEMRLEHKKRINPFRGRQVVGLGNFSGGAYPSALARYYERPDGFDKACFLSEIKIDFYKRLGIPDSDAKFRLRILDVAADKKPGKDLLSSDFILTKEERDRQISLDLKHYKLQVPADGFFIVVEHLFIESNRFTETISVKVNDSVGIKQYQVERYAPIFKGIEIRESEEKSRCYYSGISGWKPINLLDTKSSVLQGRFPAPAFKLLFTD
ncbi:carboxypeptidase-like regulatory domain-containing protein [Leeuwenhoekiella marinoflava]|uniref:carboxypeptidase-like regulatory domain-containing protein n=1 Tax=Leeuwenhoekiella marinoflava TaxID=988 RepID=UPI00300141B7